ncbi:hypothetical protein [Lentzea sp. CA-135723]|uniref:hypothetical protein n=1 Tax=Lentzea sp. CA-135723 TaxID=3239950 RepID=UPI003D8CD84D
MARIAALVASGAIVLGGVVLTAAPASAAGCEWFGTHGSAGHNGAIVRCVGIGRFKAVADCERIDNGYRYAHYGPIAADGGTSTVWCDLGAVVKHATGGHV